jgi:hypothetical protein
VTWEKGLDIDQAVRERGIVEDLNSCIRDGDTMLMPREYLPGL